ncbi:UDP-N-acetylglucosamine--N-acetylmuramyl-(pentapeptide) pyrophosphoryl-undecaprenol N-acetylglucosamine transferase [Amycolatopsis sp. AA4]|uniref:UDP-N-acetylglucosamine--N-acetylmuramyl- (pentapeptide) pyrophosphoryl-undecaprenol N-acetylglucosamine transferase n=1 Tax=Actinomycetes TaxID=1760 RepID=UPI0001DEE30D|nr:MULTISPECIES: UDP-N-acetylglucosamine--N-acetylmuramyl-(pentapeptide) pyrophosphoryl-undecaprenol N-acetylglucosamine transferase [Actinomycetes]ATY12288.1 UDP-N-acetylglucosamine--N-acetylmuramyl-(pentapeptide) pyrophosphoryl-undecaprenol N-acetylglucosamine transferase [Amycolatopsis sp. AA4]EFL08028.1 undecaprenyldiphospho-muramoylpentapeptide beta-N-acetylglucosaminyltransferase [Streptomyces sp. AA4]
MIDSHLTSAPPAERSVVIAAGGTGGHICPGLALADALRSLRPETRVCFTGTTRGMESRLIPAAGYRLHTVDMIPFAKNLGARRFSLPIALARASWQCARLLRRENAAVAVGMGGYASAPLIAGARLAGVPALIHESNAVAGRANAFSALLTENVAVAGETTGLPRRGRIVGMPLHRHFAGFDRTSLRPAARRSLGIPEDAFLVLVNGGSQGSARLNEAAVELARTWRADPGVRFLIKAGAGGAEPLNARLAAAGAPATAVDYLDRMDLAYAAADLAVCRAGSATVAELARVGLPAVLVPYPHAPRDHQRHNAEALAAKGAAELLPDEAVTGTALATVLGSLRDNPARLARMADASAGTSIPDAADRLARWALDLAGLTAPAREGALV